MLQMILAVLVLAAGSPASQAASCSDFPNQQAAQQAADTVDPDHDGIYCEGLPCPCSPAWYAQHDGPRSTYPSSRPDPLPREGSVPAPGAIHSRVSPLSDPRGVHPGLTRVPKGQLGAARRLIRKVRVANPGPKAGYSRDQFGPAWTDTATGVPWAGDHCDTRDDILRRDLVDITVRAGTNDCVIESGRLRDPYLGSMLLFEKAHASAVQGDHVVALALVWRLGGARWTRAKRVQLANDPLELLAVDQHSNGEKSDAGPSEWLPPYTTLRCAYSVRIAQVALKYDFPVSAEDERAMLSQCRTSLR